MKTFMVLISLNSDLLNSSFLSIRICINHNPTHVPNAIEDKAIEKLTEEICIASNTIIILSKDWEILNLSKVYSG
jgi:hypothetical protein